MSNVMVTAAYHPLRIEHIQQTVPSGSSVREIVHRIQPNPTLRRHTLVELADGTLVPEPWWDYIYPHSSVYIRVCPTGGGEEKDPTRTALLVAVAVASAGASGAAAAAFEGALASSVAGAAAGAAVSLAGRHLINQIAPPPKPELAGGEAGPSISASPVIEGARNRIKRYSAVPRVYGTHRMVPPFAAKSFTEAQGEDQYLNALVCWGYGRVQVNDIRIGNTPITQFEGVEIDTTEDRTADGDPSLFSKTVDERQFNIKLDANSSVVRRTNSIGGAISVDVQFPRGLFELKDNGDKVSREVRIKVEYAKAGTGSYSSGSVSKNAQSVTVDALRDKKLPRSNSTQTRFRSDIIVVNAFTGVASFRTGTIFDFKNQADSNIPEAPQGTYAIGDILLKSDANGGDIDTVNDYSDGDFFSGFDLTDGGGRTVNLSSGSVDEFVFIVNENKNETFRRSERISVEDDTVKYDVRLTRKTSDSSSRQVFDTVFWTRLRSIQFDSPVNMDNVALTAIRIKATGQLNGRLDEINGLVTAIGAHYDINQDKWVEDNTTVMDDAPSAFRNILEGNVNQRAVATSRIDLDQLGAWAEFAANKGFQFNHIFEGGETVTEALDLIATSARASKTLIDGRWSVVIDQEGKSPVQHFTPRNLANFNAEKVFTKKAHALRVKFVNEAKDYQQDEIIVYNDGFNADGSGGKTAASEFEGLDLVGNTTEAEAYRTGRYHLAVDELRPEQYSWVADPEHLIATRGDVVKATHDVPQWGTGYGRVKSVTKDNNGDITQITLDTQVEFVANTDYVARFRLPDGTSKLVDINDFGSDTETNTITPATPISTDQPADGDLAMVGVSGKETVDLLIKSITPKDDYSAEITAVDYSPAIFDAHDEAIPSFDPRITDGDDFQRRTPPQPIVDSVESDESMLVIEQDGTLAPRIGVGVSVPSTDQDVQPEFIEVRWRIAGSSSAYRSTQFGVTDGTVFATDVQSGKDYEVDVRSVTPEGIASDWVQAAASHTVVGKSLDPPDVTGLTSSTANWVSGGSKTYGIRLEWDEIGVLDLDRYEVREDTNFGNKAGLLKRPKDETAELPIALAGSYTFYVKARDSVGNYSTNATSVSITISAAGQPTLSQSFDGPDFVLSWDEVEGDFPTAYYDVRRGGNDFASATKVDTVQARQLKVRADWSGNETWRVAAVDVAGNTGTSGSTDVTINVPGAPPDFSSKIIAIDVLLEWREVSGTLPTDRYRIYRNTDDTAAFGDAGTKLNGSVDGTFNSIKEEEPGTFRYWVTAVDTAGNESSPSTLTANVDELNDFVVQAKFDDDFTGGTTNDTFVKLPGQNALLGPYDVSNTVDDHYANSNDDTTDAYINAGYDYNLTPNFTNSGSYQNEYDIGAVLGQSLITVSFDETILQGDPTRSVTIETKETAGGTYTVLANDKQGLANNVRFIRVTLDYSANSDDDLLQITNLVVKAEVRKKTSEGTVNAKAADSDSPLGGTKVTLDTTYLDIRSVNVSIKGDKQGWQAFADWDDVQDQNEIHVWVYDANGNRQDATVSYTVRGVVE